MKSPDQHMFCPHCKKLAGIIISDHSPPEKKDAPPVSVKGASKPISTQPEPSQNPAPRQPEEAEPNIVVFGHLHRATDVFLVMTVKDALALWEILPRPHSCAVVALPDPQDIYGLIIRDEPRTGNN